MGKSRGHANILAQARLIGYRFVKPSPVVNLYIEVQLPEWPIREDSVEVVGFGKSFKCTIDYKTGLVRILTSADLVPGCEIMYYAT